MEVSTLSGSGIPEGFSSPSAPYSVARYRVQQQLEAAAEANNPEVLIRRLTHAIKTASDAGVVEDLNLYQEELAAIQGKCSVVNTEAPSQGLPPLLPVGIAPPLKYITPRRLPTTPADVKARIEAGDVTSLVAMLTLSDQGVAELRDAANPAVVERSVQVFDPSQVGQLVEGHLVLRRCNGIFDHLSLRDMLEDASLPFSRVVAVVDPLFPGSQLLASQLLRHGPQLPLNSVICIVPGQNTDGLLGASPMAGPEYAPLVASLCLGGDELGMGQGTSGCAFGRAMAIVERGTVYNEGYLEGLAPLALQLAALGIDVEERPTLKGQWLFHPPAPEVPTEEVQPPAKPEGAEGEGGEDGQEPADGEAPPPADGEGEEGGEKPPPPETATYTGTNVHAWLFNGLNQCYTNDACVQHLYGQGVLEAETRGCKEWLARTERAGFWGPVVGVRAETLRLQEEERVAREEAKKEAKRQAKEAKRQAKLAEEAAAAAAAEQAAAEAAAAEAAAAAAAEGGAE